MKKMMMMGWMRPLDGKRSKAQSRVVGGGSGGGSSSSSSSST